VTTQWTIPGASGQEILGNTDMPPGEAIACVILAHGFKGYKDYGMMPRIARELAAAGVIVHRFNFSHSGMTNDIATFARADLFEQDTWSKQVFDLAAVMRAVSEGAPPGSGLPRFLAGHSRGGVTAILTANRLTELGSAPDHHVAGVITIASPSTANPLTEDERRRLMADGFLESPSSRTGQRLRIGRGFLQEQLDDAHGHDVLAAASRLACPILIIHGDADATVPLIHAEAISNAAGDRAERRVIAGADHVLNTPNPMPEAQPTSPHLHEAIDAIRAFISDHTARPIPPRVS
jgi:alpha-beta hydrolase superfamily lysophospholipase